ncbi:hypothetical protein Dimus_016465, partial [Dionaea muscipula]
ASYSDGGERVPQQRLNDRAAWTAEERVGAMAVLGREDPLDARLCAPGRRRPRPSALAISPPSGLGWWPADDLDGDGFER